MSDVPPTTKETGGSARALGDSSLGVSGTIAVASGGLWTLTHASLSYSNFDDTPIADGNVFYRVIVPPAHGTLLLSGSSTSGFTAQDITSGLVKYQHDGSASPTDTFRVWAVVTEVPGVVKPYTPNFDLTFNLPPGTTYGGFFAGVLLLGGSTMPTVDPANGGWNIAPDGATGGVVTMPFFTTRTNQVVFVATYSAGAKAALPYPPDVPVASIAYSGLTFTRLGGGTFNIISHFDFGGYYRYITVSADIYYALAPSVLPSNTMTVTWTVTGSGAPETCYAHVAAYGDLADPTHPWGTNPAAVEMHVTNTLPGSVTLNTSVDDQFVRPILFEVVASTTFEEVGGDGDDVGNGLKGYDNLGFGNASGGNIGRSIIIPSLRTSACYADIPISITGEVEPPSTERLAMDDVVAVIDADLSQNLVSLRWSDDGGHSYGNAVSQSIGEIGEYVTSLQWNRLGMCRDRSFEIFWSVPMPTALQGAWIEVTPAGS